MTTRAAWIAAGLAAAACSGNTRPALEPVAPLSAIVGSELVVALAASDPDGDNLAWSFAAPTLERIDDRAAIADHGYTATFRFTPLATDVGEHPIDFVVSDGEARDVESTTLVVGASAAGAGAPVFVAPLGEGTTLDLEREPCLALAVQVRDPDSLEVALALEDAPAGAALEATGPHAGELTWCPTADQVAASNVHPMTLVADDGATRTRKRFVVLLRRALGEGCPGAPPVVRHAPPGTRATLGGLSIDAEVSDDIGLRGPPIVYHTTDPAFDPARPDYGALLPVEMERQGGSTWRALLPNPFAAGAPGDVAVVRYLIEAEDDDDATGDCDHRARAPEVGLFELEVRYPEGGGGTGAPCDPCAADVQCGDGLCVFFADGSDFFCLPPCAGGCPAGSRCARVLSVEFTDGEACVPDSGRCDVGGGCDDAQEPNDAAWEASEAAGGGSYFDLAICGGDEDWFAVNLGAAGSLVAATTCAAGGGDLDLFVYDGAGALRTPCCDAGNGQSSACDEQLRYAGAGWVYLVVRAYGTASAEYDLTLRVEGAPAGVGAPCARDADCAGTAVCLTAWPGGYCTHDGCDSWGQFGSPCPDGAVCVFQDPGDAAGARYLCLDACDGAWDCRSDRRYDCDPTTDDLGDRVSVCR